MAYNIQTTVDAKHNIPIDYKVTNENDSKAMGNMVQGAKGILRTNEFTVLYDKGFHTGSELKTAQDLGIETIVAIPSSSSTSQAPNHDYNYEHFIYKKEADTYICPQVGKIWSGNVIIQQEYNLSRSGPYKYVRHPIYSGGLFAMLASAIIVGQIFGFIWVAFCIFGLNLKINKEEALLTKEFPIEYSIYKK